MFTQLRNFIRSTWLRISSCTKMKIISALCCSVLVLCLLHETNALVLIRDEACTPETQWTSQGCVHNKCIENGTKVLAEFCGKFWCPPDNTVKPGDPSLDFPECCPQCLD